LKLSLAGWSLHKLFRRDRDPLPLVEFPRFTREQFGLDAVELNSPFFEATTPPYLERLASNAAAAGVKLLNIAVDEAGDLSSNDESLRAIGVASYGQWIRVAADLGCAAIRANSGGGKIADRDAATGHCIDSFRRPADQGREHGVVILLENHWGISLDPGTIATIMMALVQSHGRDAVGTLVDLGNWPDAVDRTAAIRTVVPWAKAFHAKVNDIDAALNHPRFDHAACIAIAREAGYGGYLGIEFEGAEPADPVEGVRRSVRKLAPLL
jgi:sugar phosphate isomerase/epimerase